MRLLELDNYSKTVDAAFDDWHADNEADRNVGQFSQNVLILPSPIYCPPRDD